jgi:hypothetical protein
LSTNEENKRQRKSFLFKIGGRELVQAEEFGSKHREFEIAIYSPKLKITYEDPRKNHCRNSANRSGGPIKPYIKQLVMHYRNDHRIGYPNEHLAGNSDEEISSPLYATVGISDEQHRKQTQSAVS